MNFLTVVILVLTKCNFLLGQERFGSMTRVYYRDAAAAFIVFDLTRSATFGKNPVLILAIDSQATYISNWRRAGGDILVILPGSVTLPSLLASINTK